MKQIIYIILLLAILGFKNSKSSINFNESSSQSIDTTFVFEGSSIKVIVKNGELVLAEKEYFLANETLLDTTTLERTKFIPESPGALDGEWIKYNTSGRIKAKGQTKNEFGCWMDSGLFEYNDIQGNLIKTVYYDNWKNEADGCHATVHDITQKEFYADGQLKSKKHFQSGYEEGELNPVGEWIFYNEKGRILRTENYKRVYFKTIKDEN